MQLPVTTNRDVDAHREANNATDVPQNDAKRAPLDSTQDDRDDDDDKDSWQLSDMDQDDCDGLTPEAQSPSSSATRGFTTEILAETSSALAVETARVSVKAEAAAAAAVRSSLSRTTGAHTPKSAPGKGGDLATMFIKYMMMKQATEEERLALKREQFESMREDQVTKNTIEMHRIVLETRRLELEHQRMLEKQRLDADYRLAKLKCDTQYALAELRQDTASRNRGRGRAPVDSWF